MKCLPELRNPNTTILNTNAHVGYMRLFLFPYGTSQKQDCQLYQVWRGGPLSECPVNRPVSCLVSCLGSVEFQKLNIPSSRELGKEAVCLSMSWGGKSSKRQIMPQHTYGGVGGRGCIAPTHSGLGIYSLWWPTLQLFQVLQTDAVSTSLPPVSIQSCHCSLLVVLCRCETWVCHRSNTEGGEGC
jgi:hypothetical protein